MAVALSLLLVPATGRAAGSGRTVLGEVDRVAGRGAITEEAATAYRAIYRDAKASAQRLSGARRNELRAVISTLDTVAAAGNLRSGRMPLAFLTLRRNREWWTTGSLLGYGQRVTFKGSSIVWQSYPGQGIQIQWLATFGKANSLMSGGQKRYDPQLRQLLAETAALAAQRAGGIAWESWFTFDGGRPPWVSALSQGTALQAYSRAAIHLKDNTLFDVARSALGIFRTAPPTGVRIGTSAGAELLIYSFAPKLKVLNAFTQAVNGLHDFAVLAHDDEGNRLYREAEAELHAAVPRFDTGAWSLYSLAPRESDLGYHTLLRDFLKGACDRTTADRERAARRQTTTDEDPTVVGDPATGGVAPAPAGTTPPPTVDPASLPDPAVYCDTATRFTQFLKTPPVLKLATKSKPAKPKAKRALALHYSLSKISTITTRVTLDNKPVAGRTARVGRGEQTLRFTPRKPGRYAITVTAVDLAGNSAQAAGAVSVRR
ncbi:MAG: hypothetical protein JWO02_3776 [Solirubrobacterales bacterium]|nr:hypothetical protein [Solirubrobacterales bacterium]